MAKYWHSIHVSLVAAWECGGNIGEPPPTPLILACWAHTNDVEKSARWNETVRWAEVNGVSDLLLLTQEQEYRVSEYSTYQIGPLGGPLFLPWSNVAKHRPESVIIEVLLNRLKENWTTIARAPLADHTSPLQFTGRKARRLLVFADNSFTPPWGTWKTLDQQAPARRTFTTLRGSVNETISPHVVDHIDFVEFGR